MFCSHLRPDLINLSIKEIKLGLHRANMIYNLIFLEANDASHKSTLFTDSASLPFNFTTDYTLRGRLESGVTSLGK